MTMIQHSFSIASGPTGRFGDIIVKGAITLVAAAFFVGAYLQFGVAFWLSLVGALGLYVGMMMLHSLYRRSERVDALVAEVARLEDQVESLTGPSTGASPASAHRPPPVPREVATGTPKGLEAQSRGSDALQASQPKGVETMGPPSIPTAAARPEAPRKPQEPTLPDWPGTSVAPDPMHDYWAFRPSVEPKGREPQDVSKPPPLPGRAREADLESMQGAIDKLAGDVGLGEGPPEGSKLSTEEERASVLKSSVDALQSTATTMRAAEAKLSPAIPTKNKTGAPPPIAPTHVRLSTLADAVSAGRVDVHTRPIARLADRGAEHYEVHVRLIDLRGTAMAVSAGDEGLAKTGILPLIDSAGIKRVADVARSLAANGSRHSVFCSVAGESLASDQFLDELANIYREHEEIAHQLVLTLRQTEVSSFGDKEWSTLTDMRDLGFRFALSEISDSDFDFQSLKDAGFAFAKLDAAILLDGFSAWSGEASPSDLCRDLEAIGLTPIVDHINDPTTHARVAELGVRLGAGHHFSPSARATQAQKRPRTGIAAA